MTRRRMPNRYGRRARRYRGFTLVELMVSMVGGLFVSMAVFAIAKHSSRFSMQQSRAADATLQNVVAFERLRSDIARAGFLSTPNIVRDPDICPSAAYPAGLQQLASVFIQPVPPAQLSTEITLNGFGPSRIVLAGSYNSADQFVARHIDPSGANVQVLLQPNSLGMANIGYPTNPVAATLARVFTTGRALRVVDKTGRVQFGTIAGVTGGPNPAITLAAAPALQFRSGSAVGCGIDGHGTGATVNVVNIIRYDVRNLGASAAYAPMYVGGPTYEGTRRELIREELDVTGTPIANTLELMAEYAVDLGFTLFITANSTAPLTRLSGAGVTTYAGNPTTLPAGTGPQFIRAVHFWLSTRSQEADRTTGLAIVPNAPGPSALRMSLNPTDPTLPPFARVRTLQSTVPLNNQARAYFP